MDRTESRIRKEELEYGLFRSQRLQLSSRMAPLDYVDLANSVSMRLIFYDPNFDVTPTPSL